MLLRSSILFAVLVSLAFAPVAPAKAIDLRLPYDGSTATSFQGASDCDAAVPLGIVCVDLPHNARTASFTVRDGSALAMGGSYYLLDADGAFAGAGTYCRGADLTLPGNAALLVVRIEAVNGPLACLGGATGPGIGGVVAMHLR